MGTRTSPDRSDLSPRGRATRLAASLVVLGLLLAGTFWGDDDHFPFGPFRMYSVANRLDGEIAAVSFVATTASGRRVALGAEAFGLRRAEVEGQVRRLIARPEALGGLVETYERLHDDPADITALRLVEERTALEDGRPVDSTRTVLVSWERP